MLKPDEIERALVITAHPDDVDFGAAGTVANLTDAGAAVTYCLVTDGEAGGFDETISRHRMAEIRREEQTKAAAEVGVTDLVFLGHPDGAVEFNLELRHELSRMIRQVRPQVVITQSPQINIGSVYGSHADHVATGQAAWAAVYPDARNPFAFPELLSSGCEPWSVDEIWITLGPDSDHTVDITQQIDRKIKALRCHQSQHRDPDGMEARVREWYRSLASEGGLPEGSYAERFRVVDAR
ncbi:MAG: PIG-L deacetylase family protein [Ilumatobacter sp.]|uniref:PIG-L deacetylase family protein n=1 Tax=Ilumatobacter sp. TaxID=1967498 RepID=UPI00261443EB|nr:PIG-L deacetylase family protein [Ilumatobacter sp.]MDJ0769218.1 PIG-L deacetylase family protein [Ilumatobacter sp.]